MENRTIVKLDFEGPYSFDNIHTTIDDFKNDIEGIYLWCVKQEKSKDFLIHYIGESTKIVRRQAEHLTEVLGLNYGIFNSEQLQQGRLEFIWKGMWRDKTQTRITNRLKVYPKISKVVMKYIDSISIFFARTNLDQNLRKHFEGMIGFYVRNSRPEYKVLYPDDNRVMLRKNMGKYELKVQSKESILGLSKTISI